MDQEDTAGILLANKGSALDNGTALYVDAENIGNNQFTRNVVSQSIYQWPPQHPPVNSLSLYVPADKVTLWQIWAESAYSDLHVRVRGVQHFSREKSKNSADIAISVDAIHDLISGRASNIAVVSNDSDFCALFLKIREIALDHGMKSTPFLWITTQNGSAISQEISEFIPQQFCWSLPNLHTPTKNDISNPDPDTNNSGNNQPSAPPAKPAKPVVTPGDGSFELRWDAVKGADWYKVRYRPGGKGNPFNNYVKVEKTQYTITGLARRKPYVIQIVATNTAGDSEPAQKAGHTR